MTEARPAPPPADRRARGEDGFVLVVVLWIAALMALFSAALASAALDYVRSTRNGVESARVRLLADAGVRLVVLDMTNAAATGRPARFVAGEAPTACRLPDGETMVLAVSDEAGKVDLNSASEGLLAALLVGNGVDREAARRIVEAIADFRDGDDAKRLNGAEREQYLAAGRRAGPKNAAFDAVIEVASVLGVDKDLYLRLQPHLTVYSGQSGIDPMLASSELLDILAKAADSAIGIPGQSNATLTVRDRQITASFVAPSAAQAFAIRADVSTPGGEHFAREAVVARLEGTIRPESRSGPAPSPDDSVPARARPGSAGAAASQPSISYRILHWGRASPHAAAAVPAGTPQPSEC